MTSTYPVQHDDRTEDMILVVLRSGHFGRERAIGRMELVNKLNRTGVMVDERTMRDAIKSLRRKGHLICGMPGNNGGYYLAANKAEFDQFDQAEFGAKIADMNETRQAMIRAARMQFGEASQERMF